MRIEFLSEPGHGPTDGLVAPAHVAEAQSTSAWSAKQFVSDSHGDTSLPDVAPTRERCEQNGTADIGKTGVMKPALRIDGLANVRDLGGLDRKGGTVTPSGVFVRSERLDRLDSDGWEALRAYGVRTVIDLRRPDERTGHVPATMTHVHVDLDGGDEKDFWAQYEADGRWATPLYYLDHLRALPHRLASVLNAVAAADEGGILFHCSAGWDRTGLVAAVLLRTLDVTADAAVADYLRSFTNADAMASLHERSFDVEERQQILDGFGHTAESAFRDMYLDLNVEAWLTHSGLDPQTRVAIETWRGAAS